MIDMASGVPFSEAFEEHMVIGLEEFRAEFFELMSAYLD